MKSKKKLITIILIVFMLLIIAGMAGVYFYYGYTHKDEFFKGVVINGMDVGGMTVEQVEKQIADSAENYNLVVTAKDNVTAEVTKDDINYHYVPDGSVQKYFEQQEWWKWIKGYLKDGKAAYEVAVAVDYDKDMLKSYMESWDFMKPENQIEPVDSTMVYQDGQYVVTEEVDGTKINPDVLYEALVAAVDNTQDTLSVEEVGAYYTASVRRDDELLNANANTLNTQANCTIVHTLPDGSTRTIDKDMLLTWMSQDESGRYYRDDATFGAKIDEYVNELTSAVKALNSKDITFTGANNVSHTVYSYISIGWAVNSTDEKTQLSDEIYSNTTITREPVYSSRKSDVNGGMGDTFVEIDLSSQHLWYHQNGQIVLESDIVSGTYNVADRRTPAGIFNLNYKQRDRVLRGQKKSDGTYEYESPVDYWLPFNGGIGMHDASWRSTFGGDIYLNNGSHGCINMPRDKVAQLYDMISTGCIVVCYY